MPYFPPNLPEYNYMRHMCLPVTDPYSRFSEKDIAAYAVHFNQKGKPDDWMYDSFLLFGSHAPSGNFLYADINIGTTRSGEGDFYAIPDPNPGKVSDWLGYLDAEFGPEGILTRLDKTISEYSPKLGKPEHLRNIVLMIPYPIHTQSHFGRIEGKKSSLNFGLQNQNLQSACEQRLEACLWFMDEANKRWKKAGYKNLNLLGFYWMYESFRYSWDVDDHWVIKELYKETRRRKTKLFWIPFYSSFNVNILSVYKDFYFDCAFLQPNHMFYKDIKDVKKGALEAKSRYAGFEMEYYIPAPETAAQTKERHRRFRNYLDGGVKYGYMTDAACAYYTGMKDVSKMCWGKDPVENGFYHDLYHFIKGDYQIK